MTARTCTYVTEVRRKKEGKKNEEQNNKAISNAKKEKRVFKAALID